MFRANLGIAFAELQQWDRATAEFARIIGLRPDYLWVWHRCAMLRLRAGDTDGYRKLCGTMQEKFGTTPRADIAHYLVSTCGMGPDATADWLPILRLAEKNAATSPRNWPYLHALGAARYRAGRLEAAIEALDNAGKAHANGGNALDWLFLAMANHRLGHGEEARRWLAKAVQWLEQATQGRVKDPYVPTPLAWDYRLQLEVLRLEAETLLQGD
jgi:hypothetical protein